jgi:hypothetical protein
MSALLRTADSTRTSSYVRKVPKRKCLYLQNMSAAPPTTGIIRGPSIAVRAVAGNRLRFHPLHVVLPMQSPPLDPDVADTAPSDPVLTVHDEGHLITYLRLLGADAEGADWRAPRHRRICKFVEQGRIRTH